MILSCKITTCSFKHTLNIKVVIGIAVFFIFTEIDLHEQYDFRRN